MKVFIEEDEVYPVYMLRRKQHVVGGVEMSYPLVHEIEKVDERWGQLQEWLGDYRHSTECLKAFPYQNDLLRCRADNGNIVSYHPDKITQREQYPLEQAVEILADYAGECQSDDVAIAIMAVLRRFPKQFTIASQRDWYKSALQKIAIRNAHGVMVTIARDALKDVPGGAEW